VDNQPFGVWRHAIFNYVGHHPNYIVATFVLVLNWWVEGSTALNMVVVPILYERLGRPVALASNLTDYSCA
jgi:hypothetical protein